MRKTESREEQTSDSWNASNENERKGEESFIQMGFFRHCRSFHSCFEALQFPPRTLRIQEAASWELKVGYTDMHAVTSLAPCAISGNTIFCQKGMGARKCRRRGLVMLSVMLRDDEYCFKLLFPAKCRPSM